MRFTGAGQQAKAGFLLAAAYGVRALAHAGTSGPQRGLRAVGKVLDEIEDIENSEAGFVISWDISPAWHVRDGVAEQGGWPLYLQRYVDAVAA